MKNIIKKHTLLAIIALTAITAQIMPYSVFYRSEPAVVVYHHAPVVYHRHEPSLGEVAAGFVGACAGFGLVSYFENRAQERKFNKFCDMFQDLGYDRAQSKVYAKMAMDNPGGFHAVVKTIEREKESIRQINAQHDLLQAQIDAQAKLEELKHHQSLEKLTHEHTLNSYMNKNTLLMIGLFGLVLLSFFGGMLYNKRKK